MIYNFCGNFPPILSEVANFTPILSEIVSLISHMGAEKGPICPSLFETHIRVRLKPSHPPPPKFTPNVWAQIVGKWVFFESQVERVAYSYMGEF